MDTVVMLRSIQQRVDSTAASAMRTAADEIERLRAALGEIAHHYIDSEFASKEKREMARRALTERNSTGGSNDRS